MAAADYLKIAAAHLRKGSFYLKTQSRQIIAERDRQTRQKSNEIFRRQVDVKAKIAEKDIKNDAHEKAAIDAQMKEINRQIDEKKQELDNVSRQFSETAQTKQQLAQELDSRASDLESKAGSAGLAD